MTSATRVRRITATGVVGAAIGAFALTAASAGPAQAADVAPVNPVTVPVDGHAANQGFLVFVQGDVALSADEAEGTVAAGGDLAFDTDYNIAAGSVPIGAPTLPGDDRPTYLYVQGGVQFPADSGAILRVLNGGLTHVGDTSTYDAFDADQNGASIAYRIAPEGGTAESIPRIEGTVAEPAATVPRLADPSVLDFDASFTRYRALSTDIGTCPATTTLADDEGTPVTSPVPDGSAARVAIRPGVTNVLTVSAADLDALGQLTFDGLPRSDSPLVVNVTGTSFDGSIPNLANLTNGQAPFVLWNFPDATTVHVTGADALEGTIYAPRALLQWDVTQNIEGNVIAASFVHGVPARPGPAPREIHGFPFAAEVSCVTTDAVTGNLTLVKQVDGGTASASDWTLTAAGAGAGATTISGQSGSSAVTDQTVAAGDYTLSESGGPDGYTAGDWTCVGARVTGATVTVEGGDDVVCTIVNTAVSPTPTPTPTAQPTPTPTGTPAPDAGPPSDPGAGAGPEITGDGGESPWADAGSLAFTGYDPLGLTLVAGALLLGGLTLTIVVARQRARRS
ncbi:choice-of-anchor A domain-containing protein [Curtobacterium sp. PhB130]|uniref:collagen-binding domain-containing protein n=1 Tax=Curtobacterium sp. PhB130 TaxID=2485178 RepID=UPI000F4AFFFB|nr:collagen-binding domain-containing protein [Curtobacterium sp. PhB130]ROS75155.1 choice-of-anchor A domain-containing protein [Curtobacterium sp. PhB130]